MDISFNCDKCGQHIVIDAAGAGMTVQCPKCQADVVVPQAQPTPSKLTGPSKTPSVIPRPSDPTSLPPILPAIARKGTLHNAVFNSDDDMTALLVAKGADVNARDEKMATPLHYARSALIANWLLSNNADVGARDTEGRTPLLSVLEIGANKEMVEVLLANGADDTAQDNQGRTPLDLAVAQGKADVAELLKNYRSVDAILARSETTTLQHAVLQGDKAMVALLITKGADVNEKDGNGMTPLDLALAHGKKGIAELLVAKGAESTSAADRLNDKLLEAMILRDKAAVEKLIAEGADLNDALNTALLVENSDMAKLLVGMGAVPTSIDPESFESIPLYDAVFRDDMATVEKLIAEGADVNKRNELNPHMTALDWALIFDKGEIAKLLIEKGAAKADWLDAQEAGSDEADEPDR